MAVKRLLKEISNFTQEKFSEDVKVNHAREQSLPILCYLLFFIFEAGTVLYCDIFECFK